MQIVMYHISLYYFYTLTIAVFPTPGAPSTTTLTRGNWTSSSNRGGGIPGSLGAVLAGTAPMTALLAAAAKLPPPGSPPPPPPRPLIRELPSMPPPPPPPPRENLVVDTATGFGGAGFICGAFSLGRFIFSSGHMTSSGITERYTI